MFDGEKSGHDPDELLDIGEAAALLRVKVGTLYSWVSKGKVPHRKVGALVRFHRGELMAWTQPQTQDATQTTAENRRRSKLRVV